MYVIVIYQMIVLRTVQVNGAAVQHWMNAVYVVVMV